MSDEATFRYLGVDLDPSSSTVRCRYELGDERFVETTTLPGADLGREGVAEAAEIYFLLAGVSYFKCAAPSRIDLGATVTSPAERAFLTEFYLGGLGEFALKNDLDLTGLRITGPDGSPAGSSGTHDPGRVLIPFGGGLDSIVTVSELVPLTEASALFVAERPGARFAAIEDAAAVTGLEVLRAERALDQKVLESTARGYLNGHVPVTGILSALAVLTAVSHGYGAVAMSNEQSASSATTEGAFGPVNHQWSKGVAFEEGFRTLLAGRLGDFEYFSWLRNRSELSIAETFARLTDFHPVFRSCNRSFHQDPAARLDTWCGLCDKCLFIDLVLAPFLSAGALREIFNGAEPLENPELTGQLEILLGTAGGVRPFECVGDEAECREALRRAAKRPDRADNATLQALVQRIGAPAAGEMTTSPTFVPERYATPARLG